FFRDRTLAPDGDSPDRDLFRAMDDKDDIANVLSLDLAAAGGGTNPRGAWPSAGRPSATPWPRLRHLPSIIARLGRQKGHPATGVPQGHPARPDLLDRYGVRLPRARGAADGRIGEKWQPPEAIVM